MTHDDEGIVYLSRAEVARLLPPIAERLDITERTYRSLAAGRVEMPPKPGIHPRKDAFIHAMPAYLSDLDVAGIKWVSGYPGNADRGLPYISGVIVLNDPATGQPAAVMDCAEITAARTAAASGVCVRRWAPPDWTMVAILGCGEQGRYHVDVLRSLNPAADVLAYDVRRDRAEALGDAVTVVDDPFEATRVADIVVTAGPIVDHPEPPLDPTRLGERWVLLPLDFDFYVPSATIAAADLFAVDDEQQFAYYRDGGRFRGWADPDGSVGEHVGEDAQLARVACVNLGVGALDAAFASVVLDAARASGRGTLLTR